MFRVSTVTALFLVSGAAQAQQVGFRQGEIGFGYERTDVDGSDEPLHGYSLGRALDFALAPGVGMQVGASYANLEFEDDGFEESIDINVLDAHLYGNLTPDFRVGGFVGRADLGDYASTIVGQVDLDGNATAYGGEILATQGALGYDVHVGSAAIDDVDDVDVALYGGGVDYAITSTVEVFGDYDGAFLEAEEAGEATVSTLSAGVGYYLSPTANMPVRLSASVSRSSADIEAGDADGQSDTNGIRIGATVLFGQENQGADRRKLFDSLSTPF